MGETRLQLEHLLGDIRHTYSSRLGKAIITGVVARGAPQPGEERLKDDQHALVTELAAVSPLAMGALFWLQKLRNGHNVGPVSLRPYADSLVAGQKAPPLEKANCQQAGFAWTLRGEDSRHGMSHIMSSFGATVEGCFSTL